jgi:transaldolase
VDTEIDKRLDAIGTEEAKALKGKAGLANARIAYHVYEELFSTERWAVLAAAGARPQRPLWASTGVKDPAYPDTLYVTELVAAGVVNTMPEKTLDATFDHGIVTGDTIAGTYDEATVVLSSLRNLGITYNEVVDQLESEGLNKFVASWNDLLSDVESALTAARDAA